MAVYNRKEIPGLLKLINSGEIAPVYLLFGERYLCRSVSDELIGCLLPEEKLSAHNLKNIDGEQEDPANTLNLLRTYSLFSERQVVRVIDSKLLYSKGISKVLWDKAIRASDAKELKQAGRYLREMFSLARISPDREIAEEISDMSGSRWKSLFGFARPSDEDFEWIKEIPADGDEMEQGPGRVETDAAGLYAKAFAKGIPLDNILILVAEAVDKRKSFYKFIKQNGVICDLTVSKGSTKKERDDQDAVLRDLVKKTLSQFGKRLEPKALPLLLDRVGFHPVALVNETEKLAIYTGDAATITMADMNAMVGRTREEALYEFNEAFVDGKIGDTLFILSRLEGNGIHPLVIISTLRNQLRKLILIRSIQEQDYPRYSPGMTYGLFQKKYLADLKESREEWPDLFKGHPYALYMTFQKAEKFSLTGLESGLAGLLDTEYRIKGSSLPAYAAVEAFIFEVFLAKDRKNDPGRCISHGE